MSKSCPLGCQYAYAAVDERKVSIFGRRVFSLRCSDCGVRGPERSDLTDASASWDALQRKAEAEKEKEPEWVKVSEEGHDTEVARVVKRNESKTVRYAHVGTHTYRRSIYSVTLKKSELNESEAACLARMLTPCEGSKP